MQTHPSPLLGFYTTFMKDAQCAESNEKSISLFFIFRVIFKNFLSIQPIPDLSCKFVHSWKKKIIYFYFNVFMQSNEETFAKYVVGANLFILGYTNPKKNIQVLDAF